MESTHFHGEHHHAHSHECGHSHGMVKERLDSIEQRALRLKNKRVALVAAAAIRAGSLFFCPGDDIAAIGLQVYSSIDGHATHEEGHHEENGILPPPVRIERGEWRSPRRKK